MKKRIVDFLKWALSKFEDKPAGEAWPFPTPKAKPRVAKATTRPVAKKATTVAKKTTKKAK
jgi:hypothetical protein